MKTLSNIQHLQSLSGEQAEKVAGGATAPAQAAFVNTWHGLGPGHQANNDPGDTAGDRHNFGGATAGGSGHSPTSGSNVDP